MARNKRNRINNRTMKKILATTFLSILIGLMLIPIASAVYGMPDFKGQTKELPFQEELLKTETLLNTYDMGDVAATAGINLILKKIADGLLYIAAPVTIVFIAYSATGYIIAMGKQEGLDEAKKGITWSIMGLILVIMSYGLTRLLIAMLTSIPK